ncbi:MAG: putative aminoacrylate hydrolase RutD [Paracidovorax wautersii]|uniref:Putative aminoacrylate hydrolase RutD n=1 Tax=Paracidovorax wautersii TaxID=1177982 RepID=A0A7V8FST8_9BURK|nr:MAG: putative aminoacrylate hydrolase RutD [Paracidovorax wautersii]
MPWTCSQRLADGLPQARREAVPHGGHAYSATDPHAFNASLLAFLAGLPRG